MVVVASERVFAEITYRSRKLVRRQGQVAQGATCVIKVGGLFKIPRFIEYVTEFPYTPSNKVAKAKLIAQKPDLREGAWDALGS